MRRAPFEPLGEQPQWKYAYDLVVACEPGDVIQHAELAEALDIGLDPLVQEDRDKLNGIMNTARKHLESEGLPTVSTIEKFGWKVLGPSEMLGEVERRRHKAARQVERTARGLNAIPRDQLNQVERSRYDTEVRSVTAAGVLFNRKTRSYTELLRNARIPKELPQRRMPGQDKTP